MKIVAGLSLLLCLYVPGARGWGQEAKTFNGTWVVTEDFFGTPRQVRFQVEQHGSSLSGMLAGDHFEGTLSGNKVHGVAVDAKKDTFEVEGVLRNGALAGGITAKDVQHPGTVYHFAMTARPMEAFKHGTPRRHEFTPTVFYRQFSALNPPVLRIAPGDTIHTTTVDAGGNDANGIRRSAGGNPQTGPFYVEGAVPGDVLIVHIDKLKLNRDWAGSDDSIVDRGLTRGLAVKMKDNGKGVRWHLDLAHGTASPEDAGKHMTRFKMTVRPMLGCIAVAVNLSQAAPGAQDSGTFGGNMDFNELGEGATVYLLVQNPGALLYFGDGHAVQGDGELNGNALETSMDVTVTVDVIHHKDIDDPRVETADAIMTMGLQGSLDDAFKQATGDMAAWLAQDYQLTPSEIAELLGVGAEYEVSEVADRNVGVVLKLKKSYLRQLGPR